MVWSSSKPRLANLQILLVVQPYPGKAIHSPPPPPQPTQNYEHKSGFLYCTLMFHHSHEWRARRVFWPAGVGVGRAHYHTYHLYHTGRGARCQARGHHKINCAWGAHLAWVMGHTHAGGRPIIATALYIAHHSPYEHTSLSCSYKYVPLRIFPAKSMHYTSAS